MADTIDFMIKNHPEETRIFVIAGGDHFINASILEEAQLKDKQHIILMPFYEETKDGFAEKTREYYRRTLED